MNYLYILGTILFTVFGQIVLKWRVGCFGSLPDSLFEKIMFLSRLLFDPVILTGFFSAFLASFFWMAAMTKFDLSFAYPIIIAGLLILTTLSGIVVLNEPVSLGKVAGPLLILSGVIVMFSWR